MINIGSKKIGLPGRRNENILSNEALENAFQVGNWDSDKVSFYLPYLNGDKETILRDSEKSLEKLNLDFKLPVE